MPAPHGPIQTTMTTALAAFVCLSPICLPAVAQEAAFTTDFEARGAVDVAYAANGLVSCSNDDPDCRGVRTGVVQQQNTRIDMAFIDVDPLPLADLDGDGRDDTANSSGALLDLPDGAVIEFARLYVGGIWRTDNANLCGPPRSVEPAARTTVRFAPPGSDYIALDGALIGDDDEAVGSGYAAAFDVTPHLAGPGDVWVADAALIEGRCAAGGWALAVAYRTADGPPRTVSLRSGYVPIADVDVQLDLDGLLTPPEAPGRATLALGALEGDRGLDEDGARFADQPLGDALNPEDDLFNSTISRAGRNVVDRTPAHLNNIAYDFDVFEIPLAADSRDAPLRITAGRDVVMAFFVGLVTELAVPRLTVEKTARALQGDPNREVTAGDGLQYDLRVSAADDNNDRAVGLVLDDPLPLELALRPDSAQIRLGQGPFEAPAAGEVEYDAEAHRLIARPASLGPGETLAVRFEAEVLPSARRSILNSVTATWSGEAAGPEIERTRLSDSDPDAPGDQPTATPVAPIPDMGPPPDMLPDSGPVDAEPPPPDARPMPDVEVDDMAIALDRAVVDAEVDAGRQDGGLLADGEDVAGGIIFGCDAGDSAPRLLWGLLVLLAAGRRRRPLLPVLALALIALPQPASAVERFDVQRFAPAADGRHHGLRILSARPHSAPGWSASMLLDHADDPLTVEVGGERSRSLVGRQTRAHFMASGALTESVEVGVVVPVMLDAAGDATVGGPGMGDIRIQGRLVVWQPEGGQSALAVAIDGYLGTGDIDAFHGDVGRRVETRLLGSHRLGGADLRANLGYLARDPARLGNLEVEDALTLGLGAEVRLSDAWTLLPEIDAAIGFASNVDLAEVPVEFVLGARWSPDPVWSAVAGFGAGLLPGVGAPDSRFVLGFTFSRPASEPPPTGGP